MSQQPANKIKAALACEVENEANKKQESFRVIFFDIKGLQYTFFFIFCVLHILLYYCIHVFPVYRLLTIPMKMSLRIGNNEVHTQLHSMQPRHKPSLLASACYCTIPTNFEGNNLFSILCSVQKYITNSQVFFSILAYQSYSSIMYIQIKLSQRSRKLFCDNYIVWFISLFVHFNIFTLCNFLTTEIKFNRLDKLKKKSKANCGYGSSFNMQTTRTKLKSKKNLGSQQQFMLI